MANIVSKWIQGLEKTRRFTFGRIAAALGTSEITNENWDELESLLVQSDIGISTTSEIIQSLKKQVIEEGILKSDELLDCLRSELLSRLQTPPADLLSPPYPHVILMVGVNGSGKTTSAAKLAYRFQQEGKSVIMGAADTYRAGAIDQLEVWGKKINVPVIAGLAGGDSGAVTYDTVRAALSRKVDVAIIDTAGRLHTRFNLMEELKKVYKVAGKALEGAPSAVWLVLDATTGQNALQQAKAFREAVNINGIILTKLDSSARGGMVFAIHHELSLPILFTGLGEGMEDLLPFDPAAFVDGIFSKN